MTFILVALEQFTETNSSQKVERNGYFPGRSITLQEHWWAKLWFGNPCSDYGTEKHSISMGKKKWRKSLYIKWLLDEVKTEPSLEHCNSLETKPLNSSLIQISHHKIPRDRGSKGNTYEDTLKPNLCFSSNIAERIDLSAYKVN